MVSFYIEFNKNASHNANRNEFKFMHVWMWWINFRLEKWINAKLFGAIEWKGVAELMVAIEIEIWAYFENSMWTIKISSDWCRADCDTGGVYWRKWGISCIFIEYYIFETNYILWFSITSFRSMQHFQYYIFPFNTTSFRSILHLPDQYYIFPSKITSYYQNPTKSVNDQMHAWLSAIFLFSRESFQIVW